VLEQITEHGGIVTTTRPRRPRRYRHELEMHRT
jgi:hypothetical protein